LVQSLLTSLQHQKEALWIKNNHRYETFNDHQTQCIRETWPGSRIKPVTPELQIECSPIWAKQADTTINLLKLVKHFWDKNFKYSWSKGNNWFASNVPLYLFKLSFSI
jgi:hypothetical protein